jgi:replicative DNA helicase
MHRSTGISGGLFRQQRQEAMRMASVAKCIQELAAEGDLLFCDYPVKSLNEFRAIAENFSESRPFALMFLTVYDRLLQEDEARSSATGEVQP